MKIATRHPETQEPGDYFVVTFEHKPEWNMHESHVAIKAVAKRIRMKTLPTLFSQRDVAGVLVEDDKETNIAALVASLNVLNKQQSDAGDELASKDVDLSPVSADQLHFLGRGLHDFSRTTLEDMHAMANPTGGEHNGMYRLFESMYIVPGMITEIERVCGPIDLPIPEKKEVGLGPVIDIDHDLHHNSIQEVV